MTFHAKCCSSAWKADLHLLHSSKSRFFFFFKLFNERRFKQRRSLKKTGICFPSVTQVPSETLRRLDESCWLGICSAVTGGRRQAAKGGHQHQWSLLVRSRRRKKASLHPDDISRAHTLTSAALASLPRLQNKHLKVAKAALTLRVILRLRKDLCEKRRFLDNFNSLFM